MSSTTLPFGYSISKEQKYLLNSKTFKENWGELTTFAMWYSKGDKKFTMMLVRKYTSFIVDWLKDIWEKSDDIKEELVKRLTAEVYIKIQAENN